jgi:hypothetical protein
MIWDFSESLNNSINFPLTIKKMYMKKILVLVAALAVFHFSNAQLLTFGLRGGVSSSGLQVKESFPVSGGTISYQDGDKVLGWHVGVLARVKISNFYVQPEVLFTESGGDIEVSGTGYTTPEIGTIKFNNLSIPVLAGVKLGSIFRVNLGPAFNFPLSQKVSDNIKDLEQNYNSATIGYQAGIGADISILMLDLKYEGNLSKLGDSVTIPGAGTFNTDMKSSQIILSVGIKL